MVRVLNFFCVAFMGLAILALYHVSEATRVAQVELDRVTRQIADTNGQISVLQTEWERVAGPARIQAAGRAAGHERHHLGAAFLLRTVAAQAAKSRAAGQYAAA